MHPPNAPPFQAKASIYLRRSLAGGLGFEPRLTESESAVLPLNYPPVRTRGGLRISGRSGTRTCAGFFIALPRTPNRSIGGRLEVVPYIGSSAAAVHPARC